jgi:hypothetical protein
VFHPGHCHWSGRRENQTSDTFLFIGRHLSLRRRLFYSLDNVSTLKMKVFIVNLARRPDRLAAVKSGLPSEWLAGAEFTTHWPGPVDGSTIRGEADLQAAGIALYDGWQQPESNNAFWNRPLKLGRPFILRRLRLRPKVQKLNQKQQVKLDVHMRTFQYGGARNRRLKMTPP